MKAVLRELKRQKDANREGLRFFDEFESHRNRQTELLVQSDRNEGGRICVLGAGNCFDMDLSRVAGAFNEVHLVDIDPLALRKAKERLEPEDAVKVILHAPVDVSGANSRLEAWKDMRVSPEALIAFPDTAVAAVLKELPGPFDCVASTCLLSQILLTYRRVLGERHQLFQAGLITLLVTHLRVLAALTASNGEAWFITDVTTDEIVPLDSFDSGSDPQAFLDRLIENNQVFNYLDPNLLRSLVEQDPVLSASVDWAGPGPIWRWQNTPYKSFLVYAARLTKKS